MQLGELLRPPWTLWQDGAIPQFTPLAPATLEDGREQLSTGITRVLCTLPVSCCQAWASGAGPRGADRAPSAPGRPR